MEGQRNIWKGAFFTLLILILLVIVGAVAYFLGAGKLSILQRTPKPVPTGASLQLPPSLTPSPTPNETELIKAAVYALTGLDETKAEVTITKNTGTHAKGGIREYGSVGGAYWIAAKSGGEWVGVFAGQANPTCAEIAPYNFPVDLVPQCMDANGNAVVR